jgi:hypothetical protein
VAFDDTFPIDKLGPRVRDTILAEFGGRCPTIHEMAGFTDRDLLKLPGFGPVTLRKLRVLVRSLATGADAMAQWSNAKLLSEHHMLLRSLYDLHTDFKQRDDALRGRLDAVRLELRMRGYPLEAPSSC